MKKGNCGSFTTAAFAAAVLLLLSAFLSGCAPLLGKPEEDPRSFSEGMGGLAVSFTGKEAAESPDGSVRTMLALNPEFTRYELYVSPNPETGTDSKTYSSDVASFQLTLPNGTYTLSGTGFTGSKPTAKTAAGVSVSVSGGAQTTASLPLAPYMDAEINGVLQYSLNWDTVGQIPSQAELLIEQYNNNNTPDNFDDDAWDPIPISLIGENVTAGTERGTVVLLQRKTGIVQQSGSLELSPGEYRLTTTVSMDGPYPPVSRIDIAHIFSNLITPAAFFYGSGDLTITSIGTDTGSGFITYFNFAQTRNTAVSIIGSNPSPDGTRLIMVMVPPNTDLTRLTPVVECAPGAQITSPAPALGPDNRPFWSSGDYTQPSFWTATGVNGVSQQYMVVVSKAPPDDAIIFSFVFDGYPDYPGTVTQPAGTGKGTVTVLLPNGASLAGLKPLIMYNGRLSPESGVAQDFTGPVDYTVTSEDGSTTKTYTVTVYTKGPSTDTGIFDFIITNVPRAKVVIGTKPRADGKIPIVVSVPYATAPLTADGSKTDLMKLIPKITLSSLFSTISPNPNGTTDVIPFGNQNDYQEAVYTVTAQAGNTQDYVVVVARDVHYYYVKATGDDTDPDQYNGGSESIPFKTLAYAVYQAVKHNVDHIYVIGTLNDLSEGGAWEDTSATEMGNNGIFQSSGAPSVAGGNSVFNLNGAGRDNGTAWDLYITGTGSNAVLQGTAGKRVISVTGGVHITFDNITIQGGGGASYTESPYTGNGGGLYVGGNSTVIWKSGNITDNAAASGGGAYVDGSEFDFMTGSISKNTASSNAVTRANFEQNTISAASIAGGGGVYVHGDSLFWFANGEISGNKTAGSGGGVLINGSEIPNNSTRDTMPNNFMMSGGTVNGNTSTGGVWPHGGGGVYVAKGAFNMLNGRITDNSSTRQGGGVFIWSRSYFGMEGNSSVTSNKGVGSSKAICNRGITTMGGNSQADYIYIWNYARGTWGNGYGDEFTLMDGARVSGLALAFADDPQDNRNYINIVLQPNGQFFTSGTDLITTIDLESHLTGSGSFAKDATIDGDWLGKYLIKRGGLEIPAAQAQSLIKRFRLGSFTYGGPKPLSLTNYGYKLDNTGKLIK
jgi:hypothetical protein